MRPVIALLGVLAALYVTFIHPPLVLTAGPGDYADARTHCQQVRRNYVQSEGASSSSENKNWLDGVTNPYTELLADREYDRCMSNASTRLPELVLQLAVIAVSTLALYWAMRFFL
ncbi:hypothetical protein [uncultured Deinococcus sp.]|uniref:hypothetical protein n=1 Tax=uncultured Deinococcus sp. TaxID=158789 RepID=UPI0037481051